MKKRKEIARNNKTAMQAANDGNFSLATTLLAEAAMWAKQMEAPLLVGVSKNNLGIVYQMATRLDDARACFTIARETVESVAPADHPLLRVISNNLARLKAASLQQAA